MLIFCYFSAKSMSGLAISRCNVFSLCAQRGDVANVGPILNRLSVQTREAQTFLIQTRATLAKRCLVTASFWMIIYFDVIRRATCLFNIRVPFHMNIILRS